MIKKKINLLNNKLMFLVVLLLFVLIITFFVFKNGGSFYALPLEKQNVLTEKNINNYFKLLYGSDTPTMTVNDFLKLDMLYTELLDKIGIDIDFYNNLTCPKESNTPMKDMAGFLDTGGLDVPNTIWLYHKPPYKPIPSNKWTEVTHCSSWVTDIYEQKGAWFYSAKGSNIFINVGKTISFKDHPDAVKYFLNEKCTDFENECQPRLHSLFVEASKQGYDSIQFTGHSDMRCGNTAIEIVMVNSSGKGIIPTNLEFRTGYNASKKCTPEKLQNCLQCKKSA